MSTKILVSGAFDPLHMGHIMLFKEAAEYGDVIVALNSDEWIIKKKGYVFAPFEMRKDALNVVPYVSEVIGFDDLDGTACSALEMTKPDFFGNGGSRSAFNTPKKEVELCDKLRIMPVWNLGEGIKDNKYLMLALSNVVVKTLQEIEKITKFTDSIKNLD
jgi:cytidyltransferase-like protein|tara:strand:+ start:602 stop:1081 length:480 start_codon:yes stop_codon:yes gene_type:complete